MYILSKLSYNKLNTQNLLTKVLTRVNHHFVTPGLGLLGNTAAIMWLTKRKSNQHLNKNVHVNH